LKKSYIFISDFGLGFGKVEALVLFFRN
jgi:hypothetical protein